MLYIILKGKNCGHRLINRFFDVDKLKKQKNSQKNFEKKTCEKSKNSKMCGNNGKRKGKNKIKKDVDKG